MPYNQEAIGYGVGGGGGDQRDRITQALMDIQNPPPVTQMPQQPSMPRAGQLPAAAMPTGAPAAMPGAMPGAGGGMPSTPQPMFGGGAPSPMQGMMQGQAMQPMASGLPQQPQAAPAMGGRY